MNKRLLIVEDDYDIIELLSLYLNNDYQVLSTDDGSKAIDLVKNNEVDLMICDIMMPKMNGYELIKQTRLNSNIPIIVLSAKVLDQDKVLGLNIGADAYLTKPFNPLEVVAYVNALLRRTYEMSPVKEDFDEIIEVDDIKLDLTKQTVTKNGKNVVLTGFEYKILALLMSHPNRIFTKTELYETSASDYFLGYDNTMMVHISNLRSKLEDNPSNPKYIITVRGLGYKFVRED